MWELHQGSCYDKLPQFADNYFDSVVTDPPYEYGFMGKKWDSTGIAYSVEFWREVLRVLKPGGYLLSFGGTRTYHRMTCAIEDAGFEIRDCIQWIYGSGFPKSMDIGKAIDKAFGIEREVIGSKAQTGKNSQMRRSAQVTQGYRPDGREYAGFQLDHIPVTAPATPEAQQWDGWGTALKPANEPIVVARKPLGEKTVADNVLKWGTGGINIDACRVKYEEGGNLASNPSLRTHVNGGNGGNIIAHEENRRVIIPNTQGRFPANVIFDEEAAAVLDEQSGERKAGGKVKGHELSRTGQNGIYGTYGRVENRPFADTGGASRFFYCAKASKVERGASKHPTVKPLKLMRYLVRLVTPPKGIVLDPFAGSGTTLEAAILEDLSFVGIEKQAEYIPDIEARIGRARLEKHGQGNLFEC